MVRNTQCGGALDSVKSECAELSAENTSAECCERNLRLLQTSDQIPTPSGQAVLRLRNQVLVDAADCLAYREHHRLESGRLEHAKVLYNVARTQGE